MMSWNVVRSGFLCAALAVLPAAASAATDSKESSAPSTAAVSQPPAPPRFLVDGQYRLRGIRVQNDRSPRAAAQSVDSSLNHRLRLGLVAPIQHDMTLLAGFTTQASRWGDFDVTTGRFRTRDFDFERLLFIWKYGPDATLYAGRGAARFFEADLAIATGRFDEDIIHYEGFVWEKHPDPKTMLLAVYSPLLTTNLLDANPAELSLQSLAFQYRRELTDQDRILIHTGRLQPRRPILGFGGDKGLTGLMARYDHKFDQVLRAFGSVGFNLSQTDGVFFRPLPDLDLGDRTAFFGGIQHGDREKLHSNQFELYYTWTGPQAQTFVAEYPSDIREGRFVWQRQVRPKVWTLASVAHRQVITPVAVTQDDTTTAFVQLLTQF